MASNPAQQHCGTMISLEAQPFFAWHGLFGGDWQRLPCACPCEHASGGPLRQKDQPGAAGQVLQAAACCPWLGLHPKPWLSLLGEDCWVEDCVDIMLTMQVCQHPRGRMESGKLG